MQTRNPTGHGENAAILGVFTSIGLWLGGLVDDPNLSNAIVVGTTIIGKALFTAINNKMGGTLAGALGMKAMKGAQLGALLLVMPLGCVGSITGHGAALVVGQSTFSTCGPRAELRDEDMQPALNGIQASVQSLVHVLAAHVVVTGLEGLHDL